MINEPILLVEDDHDIQHILGHFLRREGYEVQPAYNGKEALDFLRSGAKIKAILLDLMMPVMDGYEFLRQFTEEGFGKQVPPPIILVSASTDVDRVARENQLRFVKKPIDLDELLKTLGTARGEPGGADDKTVKDLRNSPADQ